MSIQPLRFASSFFVSAALMACASAPPPCSPSTCVDGCCEGHTGVCLKSQATACGLGGVQCSVCAATEVCQIGLCLPTTSAAGGGAGGGSTFSDGGTGGGSGRGGGAPSSCAGGLASCAGACLDLDADENNCGACGLACTGGRVCTHGQCELLPEDCSSQPCPAGYGCNPTTLKCEPGCQVSADCASGGACTAGVCACPTGQHTCGQACVSNMSPASCGAACMACSPPSNGIATCDGQSCGFTCANGFLKCGQACLRCTPPPNATAICGTTGACDFTCQAGYRRCGSTCVPDSAVTCGSSCTVCAGGANGAAACDGATCTLRCNSGFNLCAGACAACPTPNATAFACSGSQCVASSCGNGYRSCGGQCVACPASATATACQGNVCVATACGTGMHVCGGTCRSATDPNACGTACAVCTAPAGMTPACIGGQCCTSTCKGRCGAACSWTTHVYTGTPPWWLSLQVDAAGVIHVANTVGQLPWYHRIAGAGAPASEAIGTGTMDCYEGDYAYPRLTRPGVFPDSTTGKALVVCAHGSSFEVLRWSVTSGAWQASFVSDVANTHVLAVTQNDGSIAFARQPAAGGPIYLGAMSWTGTAWRQTVAGPYDRNPGALWLASSVAGAERLIWAGVVPGNSVNEFYNTRIGGGGQPPLVNVPPVMAQDFVEETDGTISMVGYSGYQRLSGGSWSASPIGSHSGGFGSADMLVDASGTLRVAWLATSGVWLASRIGPNWYVEQLSTNGTGAAVFMAANASGKIAVGVIGSGPQGGFTVFD